MKRIVHRQPAIGWSLVFLSTLLWTPAASHALLLALRQAAIAPPAREALAPSPRRASDEEALQAAARSGQLRVIRLEPAPDREETGGAYAVLVPTRTSVVVAEREDVAPRAVRPIGAERPGACRAAAPRAPPRT